jgi:hypothetical protein
LLTVVSNGAETQTPVTGASRIRGKERNMVNHPNRRKPNIGDTRFVCWVTPYSAVEASAREKGWKPGSEDSINDLLEPEDFEVARYFPTQDAAVAYGQKFCDAGLDYWGEVHVYRQVYQIDADTQLPAWVDVHKWYVSNSGIDADHSVEICE